MKTIKCLVASIFIISAQAETFVSEKKPVIVYADMVGDLFHCGHIEFLKKAKAFGDYLIIGVIDDPAVVEYKRLPILNLEERVKVIGACRYVDEVISGAPLRPTKEWLLEHNIDYVVHGDDFPPDLLRDQYGSSLDLGIFRSVPYTPGISTSNIIDRIVTRYRKGEFLKD
jgi:cytidyltransferase-like protein